MYSPSLTRYSKDKKWSGHSCQNNFSFLLICHPPPSVSTVMILMTWLGNPAGFQVAPLFCFIFLLGYILIYMSASSSWNLELMTVPISTVLSLSIISLFLFFSTPFHNFCWEHYNFLKNQTQSYVAELYPRSALYSLTEVTQRQRNYNTCCRERATLVSRKQRT